jgi:hypothetical protein
MTTTPPTKNTAAFFVQAGVSFAIAIGALLLGVAYLPVEPWTRAFLALGVVFLVTSSFTLAKCVRDAQESQALASRVDQARVDKLLSEHDPFNLAS